ncbi:MAG: hypothetical protein EH224_03970, partial [Calditrichaeota bacterium]
MDPADEFYSPFAYGPNDPINGIDPNGMFWDPIITFLKDIFFEAFVELLDKKPENQIVAYDNDGTKLVWTFSGRYDDDGNPLYFLSSGSLENSYYVSNPDILPKEIDHSATPGMIYTYFYNSYTYVDKATGNIIFFTELGPIWTSTI